MSLTTSEMTPADIAAVTGNNGGYNNGMNGDGWWIILFLILAMGGNWGNGFGNGGNGGGNVPWFMNTDNDIERGFDQMATTNALSGLQSSVSNGFANASTQLCNCCADIQQSLCNGFAGVNQTVNGGFANAETAANARQMANMQQGFGIQTAITGGLNNLSAQFADCCCENRLGLADLKYTVATENCADRAALSDGIRDVIAAQTASTQRILDQMCSDKIDAKNDEIAQLRQEVLYARGQASQVAQNANIINGIYDRLNQCPVGTVPVYGEQPIFTCNNNGCGCGCGNF